ncbi:PorT family protein [Hymenobacter sp. BT188]|uniref:porin family protein n=1 Tax=Hymenobacter sp. BT188 TaxID=2763504 RepID=UPI001650DC4D|nr:porin family protein [Hymenobacter sp. BT188]MBC6608893.1 PorT family protein [Hymenobacter sp. BT188]
MKKTFLSLLLLGSVASAGFAQGIQLGVKAGANLSRYTGDGKTNIEAVTQTGMKMLVGFHGGVTLNAPLSSDGFFSLQPELLYSQRGYRLEEGTNKLTVRHHFIDLPVLARINADGLIFEVGPQLGYLIGTKNTFENTTAGNGDDYFDGDHQFSVGYIAGVGYQVASGPSVGIRYNGSISGVYRNIVEDKKTRHSLFQLYVGYTFGGR